MQKGEFDVTQKIDDYIGYGLTIWEKVILQ